MGKMFYSFSISLYYMTLGGDNMNVLVLYSALNMAGKENKVDTILTTEEGVLMTLHW